MNKFGFSEKEWNETLNILKKYKQIKRVVLFGSRAKNTFKPMSDVDLVLYGNEITNSLINSLQSDFEDSLIPFFFDLIAYKTITSEELKKHIRLYGKTVLGDDKNLPDGWIEATLVDYLEKIIDYRGKTPKKSKKGIITLSAKSVKMGKIEYEKAYFISQETYDKFMVRGFPKKGDILLTTEAPLGCVAKLNRNNVAVAQRLITLRGKEGHLDNDYLLYYLMSKQGQHELKSRASGSTVQGIKRSQFDFVQIFLPSFKEQKAIAAILTSFDDKIELLQEQNKTLETMAQVVFKEWFVNNSDDKKISIDEIIDFNPKEKIDRKRDYLFFDMKTLSNNSMEISNGIRKQTNSATTFRKFDTVMAKIKPCLENGKTGFVQNIDAEKIVRGSTEFIVLRAKENGSSFLNYCLARNPRFRNYAIKSMTGTSGRQRVQVNRLHNYKINFSKDKIIRFNKLVKPMFSKIAENIKLKQKLSEMRETLLPKLMCGEIRVEI